MLNTPPLTGPTPDRIANARALAALAANLPDDDQAARDVFAGITTLLGRPWPMPEAAVLGATRLAASSSSEWLRRLAAGVVCALHVRPMDAPRLDRCAEAHGLASLGVLLLDEASAAFPSLCRVAGLLNSATPDVSKAFDLALHAAGIAEAGSTAATLARAVAMALCSPAPATVLAEIGQPAMTSRHLGPPEMGASEYERWLSACEVIDAAMDRLRDAVASALSDEHAAPLFKQLDELEELMAAEADHVKAAFQALAAALLPRQVWK